MSMKDLAKGAADRTNAKLAEREKELLADTDIDWEAIAPKLTDEKERQQLMDAVAEATRNNETVGSVLDRLKQLSSDGIALADKVRILLPI